MRRFLIVLLLLTVGADSPGRNIEPADDAAVRRALHAAFNGNASNVELIARERARYERAARERGQNVRALGENIAVLAAASRRPPLDRPTAKKQLSDFDKDGEVEVFLELVRMNDPRDRYRTARANGVYEKRRRMINSTINAVVGVIQLRFFSLIQPPLDYVEYVTNGYQYLNPEERRELRTARDVERMAVEVPWPSSAARLVRDWMPLRRRTSILQARRNAEMAEDQGRLQTAAWWWTQERRLRGEGVRWRSDNIDLQEEIERVAERVRISDTFETEAEPLEDLNYRELVTAFVQKPGDRATVEAAAKAAVSHWDTPLQGELRLVESIQSREEGDAVYYRRQLEQLAGTNTAEGARMSAYLQRLDFTPAVAFDEAHATIRGRKSAFLFLGIPPAAPSRSHMTAEEARLREAAWITRARSLFVFDTLARLTAFPFLPGHGFPRDELFEAYRAAPASFLVTERGRKEARKTARAFESMRRYEEAVRVYEELADFKAADMARYKAARKLERAARDQSSSLARVSLYERLLTAYPEYRKRNRVERRLLKAKSEAQTILRIPRADLRRYPELWGDEGLTLSEELVLGGKTLGGLTRDGVALLRDDRVAYTRTDTKERHEIQLEQGTVERALRLYAARQRTLDVDDRLNEPRELKRIPVAIEGGALPGVSVAPALVPLEPDPKIRRLYQ